MKLSRHTFQGIIESNNQPTGFGRYYRGQHYFSSGIQRLCFKLVAGLPQEDFSEALSVASEIEEPYCRICVLSHLLLLGQEKQETHFFEKLISTIEELRFPEFGRVIGYSSILETSEEEAQYRLASELERDIVHYFGT